MAAESAGSAEGGTARARDGRAEAAWAGAVVTLKVAAMLFALRCGFAQISDDDYARTVIAQSFVHAPHLDPSGTSWLPFPFWLYGAAMTVLGRSLGVARAIAFALGALSPLVPYAGLRSMHCTRIVSAAGAALAAMTPWSVWLALAPVPEGWAGLAAASALFFLASRTPRGAVVAAALASVAALSRYEAWPVAALVGVVCAVRAVRAARAGERGAFVSAAALAAAGPVFWLANNALAHGDALHFVARVAEYRRRHAGVIPLATRVLEYPRALWADAPELVVAACVGAFATARSQELRARWVLPLAGAALVLSFLIYGDVRDGAPTHHAARALVPLFGVLGGLGADGVASLATGRHLPRWVYVACAAVWLAFVLRRTRAIPGDAPDTRRVVQVARGRALAKTASSLEVTPCAYEHFALIAAFGAPERVVIAPSKNAPVTPECPYVVERRGTSSTQNVRAE